MLKFKYKIFLIFTLLFPLNYGIAQDNNDFKNKIKKQLELEKELYNLLQLDTTQLPADIKESILNYIKTSKNIITKEKFLKIPKEIKTITDSNHTSPKPTPPTTLFSPNNNNINMNNLLPDKLPVPEREKKIDTQTLSPNQLKQRHLESDYFSVGIDGYYNKLIEMGYVGEGWIETKKDMEIIERIRKDIDRNLAIANSKSQHPIIRLLKGSNSKILKLLGAIIEGLDNFAAANGYRNYYNIYPEPYREVKKAPEIQY